MTHEELAESLERAERWFAQLPNVSEEHVQAMIGDGFLSYNDLTFIDGAELTDFTGLPLEQADEVIAYAEEYADHMERSVEDERNATAQAIAEAEAEAEAEEIAARQRAADEAAAAAANLEPAGVSVVDGAEATIVDGSEPTVVVEPSV